MKVVILCGGYGTRLSEETSIKPKPLVEVGGKPILWHIMKHYAKHGFKEFILCLGYKGYALKEYFNNYFLHQSDITFDLKENSLNIHNSRAEDWKVSLIDTGLDTMTGGRIKRIQKYVGNETFMLTYGDGLSNVNIRELIEFHKTHKKSATVTAVQPSGRFGALDLDDTTNHVLKFHEKPKGDGAWINGGFFVLEPEIFDYIKEGDKTIWELDPLEKMTNDGKLVAYKHNGFWRPIDTLRDKKELESLYSSGNPPWVTW